ncbi:hypothetical protein MYIN104542_09735 [Mycobacterium intermedium]
MPPSALTARPTAARFSDACPDLICPAGHTLPLERPVSGDGTPAGVTNGLPTGPTTAGPNRRERLPPGSYA